MLQYRVCILRRPFKLADGFGALAAQQINRNPLRRRKLRVRLQQHIDPFAQFCIVGNARP